MRGGSRARMPRYLDLVRHGHAVAGSPGADDRRTLSDRGRTEVARLARELAKLGWRPDRAFASPLMRAQQTVALLLEATTPGLAAESLDALCPEIDPDETIAHLTKVEPGHVVVVSHLPLLDLLVERLAGHPVGFEPATLVRLEYEGALATGACRVAFQLRAAALS